MKKKCTVNFYGMIADKIGKSSEDIELSWKIGQNARDVLITHYPVLKNLPFQVATDIEIATELNNDNFTLISLLPPFSGG